MTSNVRADLWQSRDSDEWRAVYWIKRARTAGASFTAKQAAKCFWIILCDSIGEPAAHRELQLAGIETLPVSLVGIYGEYEQMRLKLGIDKPTPKAPRQKRERAQRRDTLKSADSTKKSHQHRQPQRISDATPRAA